MKKTAIILALLILLTACSANVSESTINTITSNRSTETTSEISEANTSITDATSEINTVEDWEFNKDKLSDRLTELAMCDASWSSFNLVKYSLCDLDFDNVPEFITSYHSYKANTFNDVYDVCSGGYIIEIMTTKKDSEIDNADEFIDIFNGIYYIDNITEQRYFIESTLMGWGADGFSNQYRKVFLNDGKLENSEYMSFPLSDDGSPQYDPEERINLFAPDDKFENLYIKGVTLEELWRSDNEDIEKEINEAMEKLVNDYYSGIENNGE